MERLTPEDLRDIFGRLQAAGLETVIVGGKRLTEASSETEELGAIALEPG